MSTNLLPKYAFLVAGSGRHKDKLQAFDRALLSAGPFKHNLVTVSSILPPTCKIISAKKGFSLLKPGQITFCVMANQDTNEPGEVVSAAIGLVKTKDPKKIGYISEHHGHVSTKAKAGKIAERLAIEMFAKNTKTPVEKLDFKYKKTVASSIKQSGSSKEWVCAVALCIFVL